METLNALKMAESTLTLVGDRVNAMDGKLEDLLFRAQRIANALKNNLKSQDTMFGYDLQAFRRDIRTFSIEVQALPNLVGGIERTAEPLEAAVKPAQAIMRLCERVSKLVRSMHDHALLAHQHIREADHKVEAWYMVQEIEQMAQKAQGLPTIANKLVIRVSSPGAAG